jgi:hypothetical protein
MDMNQLMASFFFGLIGTGMFMYGKKSSRPVPLLAGVALIIVPYFIPNLIAMTVVSAGLCALPWLLREA